MSRVGISALAEKHLEAIYEFTFQRWGGDQAARYTDRIIAEFSAIADRAVVWRPLPVELGIAGFSRSCGKHLIYFRESTDGLTIVAILHERMARIERLRTAFGAGS